MQPHIFSCRPPVKIKHLLALLIIITNTLINSVWASVHLIASDHDTLESPHLHIVTDLKTLLDFGQDLDDSSQGETEETHFHVLSDLTTLYLGVDSLKASLNISSTIPHYRTLTYSPPIQPPTQAS
jgi:hypothetical protein